VRLDHVVARGEKKMLKRIGITILTIILTSASTLFAADTDYCTNENVSHISRLYEHRTHETAKILFNILDCGGSLSKKTKNKPYIALVGGLMRTNPELIEDIYASVESVKNLDAPKIYLDALWFCASAQCRTKLRSGPFSLPKEDVDALLKEMPPDPFTLPLNSPSSIDVLWGYFTATGESKIVQRIFDFVQSNWNYYETPGDIGPEQLVLIQSARWSLTSMAAQHQKVQAVLEAERNKSPEAAMLLTESEKKRHYGSRRKRR
jgi:hypothetical protein